MEKERGGGLVGTHRRSLIPCEERPCSVVPVVPVRPVQVFPKAVKVSARRERRNL